MHPDNCHQVDRSIAWSYEKDQHPIFESANIRVYLGMDIPIEIHHGAQEDSTMPSTPRELHTGSTVLANAQILDTYAHVHQL
jgi:hypothetical protein